MVKNQRRKIEIRSKEGTKTKGIQKPRGHKEGRASFATQSQYKVSRIHTSNPREEQWKNKEREGGDGAKGEEEGWSALSGAPGREEKGEGVFNPLSLD